MCRNTAKQTHGRVHLRIVKAILVWLLYGFLLTAVFAPKAFAASTVDCHCFQDRQYSPGDPTAVDPYLLATTQNSTLAVAYGIPRKEIVRQKMLGADGKDLWIAYALAELNRRAASDLMVLHDSGGTWRRVLLDGAPLQVPYYLQGVDEVEWAQLIVNRAAQRILHMASGEIAGLRKVRANDQELLLAALLARSGDRPAMELLAQARSAAGSWGTLADSAGIDPRNIEKLIREIARRAPAGSNQVTE